MILVKSVFIDNFSLNSNIKLKINNKNGQTSDLSFKHLPEHTNLLFIKHIIYFT